MAIEVATKDCTGLSDGELAEMADLSMGSQAGYDIGLPSKAREAWVIGTTARDGERLQGCHCCTLARHRGHPPCPGGPPPRPRGRLGWVSLATLAGSAGIGFWLATQVLHPVQVITRAARQISETDLSRRLNLKSSDEMGELANTFDRVLGRLQSACERQRQRLTDARAGVDD